MATTSRGIRNNNPGNIRRNTANKWQGRAAPHQQSVAQSQERAFEVFISPEYGIRAIAVLLTNYYDFHGIRTIRGLIERWAPGIENDTEAYIKAVCIRTGLMPNVIINLHSYEVMRPLVEAIIFHENGAQPYSSEVLDKGLAMAGYTRPVQPSALMSGAVVGSATAAVSSAGSLVIALMESTQALQEILAPMAGVVEWVPHALIGLAVASAVFSVWARVRDQKRMI